MTEPVKKTTGIQFTFHPINRTDSIKRPAILHVERTGNKNEKIKTSTEYGRGLRCRPPRVSICPLYNPPAPRPSQMVYLPQAAISFISQVPQPESSTEPCGLRIVARNFPSCFPVAAVIQRLGTTGSVLLCCARCFKVSFFICYLNYEKMGEDCAKQDTF